MSPRTRALLLLLLSVALLWVSNEKLLYFRDNFHTHYPVKSLTAGLLSDGLPLWNPYFDGGQPLAGNANTLTFYPTTILFLFLPAHIAFNLHFVIHLVVAWFGMRWLLQQYDVRRQDGSRVAWIYLLSGTTVSCLIFYNLIVATAWMPWGLGALVRLLRHKTLKDGLYLGACCGLLGLAAEPVVVIGFAMLALALFASNFSRSALRPLFAAVVTAVVISSPQLIAFSEIAGETERAHFPFSAKSALAASLGPDRLAELVTGPIYGSVLDHSKTGYWVNEEGREFPPFFLSVMLSSLAIVAVVRRPKKELLPFQLMALLLLVLAVGHHNPLIESVVENFPALRIFRYPEKLALLITLIAAVITGFFFRDLKTHDFRRAAWVVILLTGVTVTAVLLLTTMNSLADLRLIAVALLQTLVVTPLLFTAGVKHKSRILGLLALLPLGLWATMIIPLDDSRYYSVPSPVAVSVGDEVIKVSPISSGEQGEMRDTKDLYRFYAFRLNPGIGMVHGTSYALSGSPEGMHSYLSRLPFERFGATEPFLRLRYLRIAGASYLIESEPLEIPGITLAGVWHVPTRRVFLYHINDSRPLLWEPSAIVRAQHVNEAVGIIESPETDPGEVTVAPQWVNENVRPRGRSQIELLSRSSQRMSFQVESEAETVVVVNQTWFSAWKARAGDRELVTFPADISRLGIVVPQGTTTVELEFGRHRILIGFALALSAATMLYVLGLAIASSRRTAAPSR